MTDDQKCNEGKRVSRRKLKRASSTKALATKKWSTKEDEKLTKDTNEEEQIKHDGKISGQTTAKPKRRRRVKTREDAGESSPSFERRYSRRDGVRECKGERDLSNSERKGKPFTRRSTTSTRKRGTNGDNLTFVTEDSAKESSILTRPECTQASNVPQDSNNSFLCIDNKKPLSGLKLSTVPHQFLTDVLGLEVHSESSQQSTMSSKKSSDNITNMSTHLSEIFSPASGLSTSSTTLEMSSIFKNLDSNRLDAKSSLNCNLHPAKIEVEMDSQNDGATKQCTSTAIVSETNFSTSTETLNTTQVLRNILSLPRLLADAQAFCQLIGLAGSSTMSSQPSTMAKEPPTFNFLTLSSSSTQQLRSSANVTESPLLSTHIRPSDETAAKANDPAEGTLSIEEKLFDTDSDGDTTLHIMLAKQNHDACRLLIRTMSRRTLNIANNISQTPLHIAAYLCDSEMIQELVTFGANVSYVDNDGNTPVHLACTFGTEEHVCSILKTRFRHDAAGLKEALQHKNYDGNAAIHIAVRLKKEDVAKLLIEAGCDINIQENKEGRTVLHVALEESLFDLSEFLIRKGASVSVQSYNDTLALHIAAKKEHKKLVTLLIEKGSPLSWKNTEAQSPKDMATSAEIKSLLEREMVRRRRTKLPTST